VSLRLDAPLHAVTLTLFLQALAENCGPDLLRVKGIVAIRESPETPAVVHGVQHVFHPVDWLDQWPSEDRSSRFVCIGRRLDVDWLRLLLQTIEEEVECATRP
jgi:G3E family GTPase